jgi:hypothetical protein
MVNSPSRLPFRQVNKIVSGIVRILIFLSGNTAWTVPHWLMPVVGSSCPFHGKLAMPISPTSTGAASGSSGVQQFHDDSHVGSSSEKVSSTQEVRRRETGTLTNARTSQGQMPERRATISKNADASASSAGPDNKTLEAEKVSLVFQIMEAERAGQYSKAAALCRTLGKSPLYEGQTAASNDLEIRAQEFDGLARSQPKSEASSEMPARLTRSQGNLPLTRTEVYQAEIAVEEKRAQDAAEAHNYGGAASIYWDLMKHTGVDRGSSEWKRFHNLALEYDAKFKRPV